MDIEDIEDVKTLVRRLQERHPDIRPYGEEDWDWDWADEGMEALEFGDYVLAEFKFQQLIVSQPRNLDGYEGLALVCQAMGRRTQALFLIDHAVKIAKAQRETGSLDAEALDEILAEQKAIQNM